MKYITIKDLKREAKNTRKNNNDLKNHMDSLNFVATKHNYSSWNELLDNSAIIIKPNDPVYYLNELIDEIIKQREIFIVLIKEGSYSELSSYMNERFLKLDALATNHKDYNSSLMWRERAKKLMVGVCLLYTHKRELNSRSLIENYLDLRNLSLENHIIYDIQKYYEELKKYEDFKILTDEIIIDHKIPESFGTPPSFDTLQQWGFLTMHFYPLMDIHHTMRKLGISTTNRNDIINFLKDNMHLMNNNKYLDPNNKTTDYIKSITNNSTIYTDEDKLLHLKLLNHIRHK